MRTNNPGKWVKPKNNVYHRREKFVVHTLLQGNHTKISKIKTCRKKENYQLEQDQKGIRIN
jgi:hypothetical protein